MGRGNFTPSGEYSDQWYIDLDPYGVEDEVDEYTVDYDVLQDDIYGVMDAIQRRFPSFCQIDMYGDGYWGMRYMLENQFFRIGTADNQWSEAVFIEMRGDVWKEHESLASRHFGTYCKGIQEILLDTFGEIYLRSGAWCSAKLTKEGESA